MVLIILSALHQKKLKLNNFKQWGKHPPYLESEP